MDFEFDYYLISSAGVPNVPILMNHDELNSEDFDYDVVYDNSYVEVDFPIYLALNPPYPAKPNFNADLFQTPLAVYSQKIHDILIQFDIKNYQLIPGIIVDRTGEEHTGFWLEHIYNEIACIDTEKSECDYIAFGKTWGHFEKIVLNNELLKEVPLKDRLIIWPAETSEFMLYHKTIVDAIMAVKPINIKFIPVNEWYQGIQFR